MLIIMQLRKYTQIVTNTKFEQLIFQITNRDMKINEVKTASHF